MFLLKIHERDALFRTHFVYGFARRHVPKRLV